MGVPRVGGASLLSLALASSSVAGESGWRKVESPHFVVATDASSEDAMNLALELERIRAAFRETTGGQVDPPQSVVIVAGRRAQSVEKLVPGFAGGGFYLHNPYRQFMVMVGRYRGYNPYQVTYHEYVHLLNALNYRRIPLWLNEGLAMFFSFALIEGDDLERAVKPYRALVANEFAIPLDTFFAVDHSSSYYGRHQKRTSLFYAQAWALTHLILVGDPTGELRRALQDYLTLLDAYVPSSVAYRRTFGRIENLAARLEEDVRRRFYYARLQPKTPIDKTAFSSKELSAAEWSALRGEFLLHRGEIEKARPLLEEAVRLDPTLGEANTNLGILHYRAGDRERAQKALDESIRAGYASYLTHYHRGLVLQESQPPAPTAEVENAFATAISLNARFAPAFAALAALYGSTPERVEEAIAMAYMAAENDADNAAYQVEFGRLLVRGGRGEEAPKVAARAVTIALESPLASVSDVACRQGNLKGFAEVVLAACQRAVDLGPDNPRFRDSRGLGRAILGDFTGAIEDFRFFVTSGDAPQEEKDRRRLWIETLEKGINPIDGATIASITPLRPAHTERDPKS
jgi:tetratricopeptide (TPR) repeat protein